ncbi:MAG: hypothetical protein KAR56_01795 [Thermoplasmata archaeon]|nr:hypothetical protein [Thermoplasmata archaeon]
MTEKPKLAADLLAPYIKSRVYEDDKYSIEIELVSSDNSFSFLVGMRVKEPHHGGAYPQKRISLEQHDKDGHEGVHVQIHYHAIENAMKIGKIYVTLDIKDDMDLLETAEGFVYTLYEIFLASGPKLISISEEIFNVPLITDLKDKKPVLIMKMKTSLAENMIQIRDQSRDEIRIISPDDFGVLLKSRSELVPLLGGIVSE